MNNRYPRIAESEVTPKAAYLSRRAFIMAAGVVAGSMAIAACGPPGAPGRVHTVLL
ncbi:MAG: twin-arginine translocation signal domain-containing protein [Chloroflexi bacterium]|nr:twin-arginine translocation signal domain-containing protein [Chloroflexota bacterium]